MAWLIPCLIIGVIDVMVQLYDQREAVENYGRIRYAKGKTTATLDNIRDLMKNLKISAEQAMKLLKYF